MAGNVNTCIMINTSSFRAKHPNISVAVGVDVGPVVHLAVVEVGNRADIRAVPYFEGSFTRTPVHIGRVGSDVRDDQIRGSGASHFGGKADRSRPVAINLSVADGANSHCVFGFRFKTLQGERNSVCIPSGGVFTDNFHFPSGAIAGPAQFGSAGSHVAHGKVGRPHAVRSFSRDVVEGGLGQEVPKITIGAIL